MFFYLYIYVHIYISGSSPRFARALGPCGQRPCGRPWALVELNKSVFICMSKHMSMCICACQSGVKQCGPRSGRIYIYIYI